MKTYRNLVRPLLFCADAERAHQAAVQACRVVGRLPWIQQWIHRASTYEASELVSQVAGISFANPVGLAAGWDKSGRSLRMLDHLGFGFAEIGSISAQSSTGNPRPRLFRLPHDRAIVVNYGLPNAGAAVVAQRLAAFTPQLPLGINIVKTNQGLGTKANSAEEIFIDYETSAQQLHRYANYLMLNLSCPNVEGGQDFFAIPGNIRSLLERLSSAGISCPVFLKVAPDPAPQSIERLIAETASFSFVRGFMFNLPAGTAAAPPLRTSPSVWRSMPGAVAGQPVARLINTCIRELYLRMPRQRFAIVAAGGIFSAADAYEKIQLGASLVQIYTALVYEGPGVVKEINHGLCQLLQRDGHQHLAEAIGTHVDVNGSC